MLLWVCEVLEWWVRSLYEDCKQVWYVEELMVMGGNWMLGQDLPTLFNFQCGLLNVLRDRAFGAREFVVWGDIDLCS